jgi:hypothetical protein
MPGKFDWGLQSKTHRRVILEQMMRRWGMTAQVFAPVPFANGYSEIYPENTLTPQPITTCDVLIGAMGFTGFRLSNYISLADKVGTSIDIVTLESLVIETQLVITYPDNLILNLRVIEAKTQHPLSRIGSVYTCVVT